MRMRARLVAPAVLSLALGAISACGGAKQVAEPKQQPAIGAKEATKGATDVVTSIYDSIGHGDSDGLMTLAAEQLVVFGPRRGDALANRSDALVALGKEVSAKKKAEIGTSTLQVTPAAGGHSAWAYDVLDVGGEPMVITAVLTNSDDIWLVDAAALARTPAAKVMAKELARDAIVPPGMTGFAAKIDTPAQAVVDKFQHALGAQSEWGDDLAARDTALVIGPNAGEVAHGKHEVKKLWKKRLKANTREVAVGDIAAGTTPDGQLAWVSAPVTRASDDGAPVPLRVFAIYENRASDWKLVALQESIAVDAPGAGAALAKKAPAAAPAKPADDAAPAKPEKKSKKKAKPAASDDTTADADAPAPPKKKTKKKPVDADADASSDRTSADDDAPAKPMHKRKKPAASDDDNGEQLSAHPRKHKKHTDDDDVAVQDD
jgi:hypothetical protein